MIKQNIQIFDYIIRHVFTALFKSINELKHKNEEFSLLIILVKFQYIKSYNYYYYYYYYYYY